MSKKNNSSADTKTIIRSEKETVFEEPKFYQVVLLNDDYTSMEFVIKILMTLFGKDYETAYDITMHVHNHQKGVAGVYPYEIAAEKRQQAKDLAELNEFPLRCIIEQV